MRLLLTLPLLCITLLLSAQSPDSEKYLAELKKINAKKISISKKCAEIFSYTQEVIHDDDFEVMFKFINQLEEYVALEPTATNKLYLNALKGYHYSNMQMFADAIRFELTAIAISKTIKNPDYRVLMAIYNTTGICYSHRDQNAKAARYFAKALALAEKHKVKTAIAIYSNNLGLEYNALKEHLKARAYMKRAASMLGNLGLAYYLPTAHLNIGTTFQSEREYDSAMFYYRASYNAVKHSADSADAHMMSLCLCNISEIHSLKGNQDSSLFYNLKAFAVCDTVNDRYQMINVLQLFANIYYRRNEYKQAHHFLREYIRVKDALFTQEEIQKTTDAELAQASLARQHEVALLKKNHEIDQIQNERNRIFSWAVSILSIVILIVLVLLLVRFREKKRANIKLTAQKDAIEIQQKEITDSINYAKRIQHALLPPAAVLDKCFSSHFIFYKPKHIVGGDFYHAHLINENTSWLAVIDCTGHGVPGGFMSVLAHNALTKVIVDEKITSPAHVLTRMSELVTDTLSKQQTQNLRDGMDMTLCKLVKNNAGTTLYVAAANNPLWVVKSEKLKVKSGVIEKEENSSLFTLNSSLHEVKPDKQHVGYSETKQPFTEQVIELQKGDKLYLFTDGYADQFGGDHGKKYKYKRLKELIIKTSELPLKKQALEVEQEFERWKGNHEQMDDVCIVGIEI